MDSTDSRLPLALVTNDDGIHSAGVHRLIDYLEGLCRVVCVCPDRPRSAQSMAITVDSPLRLNRLDDYRGAAMFSCNGTPTDCVKLAMHTTPCGTPDIVISGINHGSNAAINVVYSGTMGAALEGAAFGLRSVGFSLTDHDPDAEFSHCRPFIRHIVAAMLANEPASGVALNVNFPKIHTHPETMRVVRGCRGKWTDEYREYIDPSGRTFYWLTGKFINLEPDATDTDEWCLAHGEASIVATLLDRTAPGPDTPRWLSELDGVKPE